MDLVGDKERLDKLLVSKGHAASREEAKALILAGAVLVDGKRIEKVGSMVPYGVSISLKKSALPFGGQRYVSRGGLKLEEALDRFGFSPKGLTVADIGASTGGFTDCLIQRGAHRVYAVDVGYGQLAWKLRQDPRVVVLERTHICHLPENGIPEPMDLIVIDVSFISLDKVLPEAIKLLKHEGFVLALVKPQFEVGRGEVGKGGIIRDPIKRQGAVARIKKSCQGLGFKVLGDFESSVHGRDGNIESFILLKS